MWKADADITKTTHVVATRGICAQHEFIGGDCFVLNLLFIQHAKIWKYNKMQK